MQLHLSRACLLPLVMLLSGAQDPPRIGDSAEALKERIAKMEALEIAQPMAAGIDALIERLTESSRFVTACDGWVYGRSLNAWRFVDGPDRSDEEDGNGHYTPGGHALTAILDFNRQLDEHGIELLVVPIPTRLHVYPELVIDTPQGDDFEGYAPGLTRFLLELTENGVEVVDLLPALSRARGSHLAPDSEQVFLRANCHWAPKGVTVAAQVLSERLRATAWFADVKQRELPEPEHLERSWSYRDQPLAPGAEPPKLEFDRILNGRGRMTEYDPGGPVLVLGDSFVSLFSAEGADLARQMHRFAGFPMDMISNPGGAAQGSRKSLARRKSGTRDKRLVIWLWASESLMMPARMWQTVDIFQR